MGKFVKLSEVKEVLVNNISNKVEAGYILRLIEEKSFDSIDKKPKSIVKKESDGGMSDMKHDWPYTREEIEREYCVTSGQSGLGNPATC